MMSSLRSCSQLAEIVVTPYLSRSSRQSFWVSSLYGVWELTRIRNGLPCFFNSLTVSSSASMKFSLGSSPKLPSVVTTRPIVACSWITLRVPTWAASWKGMAYSNHGVLTIRSLPSSMWPEASLTRKPTQSISLI